MAVLLDELGSSLLLDTALDEFAASLEEERFAAMPEEESVLWYSSQVSRSMGLSGSEQERKNAMAATAAADRKPFALLINCLTVL